MPDPIARYCPQIWNVHIAPLILRSMTDAHITFAWILKSPVERAKKYIVYGLGQDKLYLEYLKADRETDQPDQVDERLDKVIEFKEKWLNRQRRDFLIEVNVGSWSGMNTREMATEAECETLYKFAYVPFSGPTHNMWQHVSLYNLETCKNPLHKYHKVPAIFKGFPEIDFVYRSAKYVDRTYRLFDETYGIKVKTVLPHDWFVDEFEKLSRDKVR